MAAKTPTIIFGAAAIAKFTDEQTKEFFDLFNKYGVKQLDSARLYEDSEETIGKLDVTKPFIVDTKFPAFGEKAGTRESVLSGSKTSLGLLKRDSVDTYYLHCPDATTPIEETLEAVQEVYKGGHFKRFGLSNFPPEDVKKIYDHNKSKGWVLPTVYQGNYNAVARSVEDDLFPVLRELGIRFNAYSPIGGGFLVQNADSFTSNDFKKGGRFDKESFIGQMYHGLYGAPSLIESLKTWQQIAQDAGISKAALAYRWVAFHSHVSVEHDDGIIVGASRPAQLEETLKALQDGPLDANIAKKVDQVWDKVKAEAPRDNYHSFFLQVAEQK